VIFASAHKLRCLQQTLLDYVPEFGHKLISIGEANHKFSRKKGNALITIRYSDCCSRKPIEQAAPFFDFDLNLMEIVNWKMGGIRQVNRVRGNYNETA